MQFSHFRVQLYPKLHEKACSYLYIIYLKICSLIFQDSYMRSDNYDHLSQSLRGHVQTIFGKIISVIMTLRGGGGGGGGGGVGVACDANFFVCVLLSFVNYYSKILLQLCQF